jgi:hypothetical protein
MVITIISAYADFLALSMVSSYEVIFVIVHVYINVYIYIYIYIYSQ